MLYLILFLKFVYVMLRAYDIVLFIYIILSWIPIDQDNFLVKFIKGLVDPIYNWIKAHLPPLRIGMLDLTIFYLFISVTVLEILVRFILKQLIQMPL